MSLTVHERTKALGRYGEKITMGLLESAGFTAVRYMGAYHPFADYYAERKGHRFIISVRTRNMYLKNANSRDGKLKINPCYNICKKTTDVRQIANIHNAEPAWITIQVDAEAQSYSAYFGTIADLNAKGERYSVPMTPDCTAGYDSLASDWRDLEIKPEWTNRQVT